MMNPNFFETDIRLTLTPSEEYEAIKAYKLYKDYSARDRVVFSTMNFALQRAKVMCNDFMNYIDEDIKQEVYLALCDAIDHFDYEKGLRFYTLAFFYIEKYVRKYITTEVGYSNFFTTIDQSYYDEDEEYDEEYVEEDGSDE